MRGRIKIHAMLAVLLAGTAVGLSGCAKKRVLPQAAANVTTAPIIKPAPAPSPTISLMASPSAINKGEFTILIWSSENATSVKIDGGVGPVEAIGKQSVTPPSSTTYTAVAEGPAGSSTASTRVTVIERAAVTPPPRRPISDSEFFSTRIEDMFFDFDKYNLREDAIVTLGKDKAALTERPSIRIIIEGHCDERGSEKYNLALGDKRAQAARQYLLSNGIDPSRIDTISYGEERPFAIGHNEEAWAKNRRAHFVLKNLPPMSWIWLP